MTRQRKDECPQVELRKETEQPSPRRAPLLWLEIPGVGTSLDHGIFSCSCFPEAIYAHAS